MKRSGLRQIPSVDRLLRALGDLELPRPAVLDLIRRELAGLRRRKIVLPFDDLLSNIRSAANMLRAARIQPVINGTGIIIHTNFGRAPLGPAVIEALTRIGSQYNNIEYALAGGVRGSRAAYLENNLALLCSAEAATVVNNNAAALVLILRHFCGAAPASRQRANRRSARVPPEKNEVVISRGELIQIGGGFRIPEILESAGARLREVGTTNKTSLADYARAIGPRTALILKVHRSNFFMEGFVQSPATHQIAALARKRRIPFVEDLGSGATIDTQTRAGVEHEPTPAEILNAGVDLVCFSGDKLLGGPQAGIIAGRAKHIAGLKGEPLFRALRCDKLILTALEATTDIHLNGRGSAASDSTSGAATREADPWFAGIPVLAMLHISTDDLRARAAAIIQDLAGLPVQVVIGSGRARIGGGALPRSFIPSTTLDLTLPGIAAQQLAARLRACAPPVIGYIEKNKLKIDLRTVFPSQDAELTRAIRSAV